MPSFNVDVARIRTEHNMSHLDNPEKAIDLLYIPVAEFGLFDPHTVSGEGWVLQGSELSLGEDV